MEFEGGRKEVEDLEMEGGSPMTNKERELVVGDQFFSKFKFTSAYSLIVAPSRLDKLIYQKIERKIN